MAQDTKEDRKRGVAKNDVRSEKRENAAEGEEINER